MKKQRLFYGMGLILLLLIEVLIALFVRDNFVRPYLGDVLVVIVIYLFVKMLFPKDIKWIAPAIFLFAVTIEVLQYFKLVELLGLQDYTMVRIALGSHFDPKDIVCYGVGCLLIMVWETSRRRSLDREI